MTAPPPPAFSPAPDTERFWELEAELRPEGEEVWSLFCHEQGSLGAEVLQEGPPRRRLRHFFAEVPFASGAAGLAAFAARYPQAPRPLSVALRSRVTQAWETAWRSHFAPLPLGARLVVCPPWDAPGGGEDASHPRAGRLRIVIDPGQGFGTGRHPSTALALLLLEQHLAEHPPPPRLLDVGAGSGILAIAAGLLGVPQLWLLDVDRRVMPEILHNFGLSGLPAPRARVQGGPDCLRGAFPLVMANIVTAVLLRHRDDLAALTDEGGYLMVSGMLESERERLLEAYREVGLRPVREARRDGWYAGCLHRN
jgi:ribosomal protein L11 methyltransferase